MKSIILLRTSTKEEQNPKLQLKECQDYNQAKGWECLKVFEKQESAYKNEEGVWKEEIDWAIDNGVSHIIVWNVDRFSRLPAEKVLNQVKMLSVMHALQLHAVHGDSWSEVVESVGKLKELGFIGEALSEFLEKLLKGMEFHRANMESKVKGERVKMAVRKGDVTKSYRGNKWGRRELPKHIAEDVQKLFWKGYSVRKIAKEVTYWDSHNKKRNISKSSVQKILRESIGADYLNKRGAEN